MYTLRLDGNNDNDSLWKACKDDPVKVIYEDDTEVDGTVVYRDVLYRSRAMVILVVDTTDGNRHSFRG